MSKENLQIVVGLVLVMIVLLIAAGFIFVLVTYASKRKKLFRQEKENLQLLFNQQLLQSRLEMQEQTFDSISQEIHDNVGQSLSLAKVQANIIGQGEKLNPAMIADLKDSISQAMTDLRDIAKSLNSDRIRQTSLAELTNHELQRIGRLGSIQTFLFMDGQEQAVEEHKKLIIFRIIQESLQNIIKHAKAKKIEVFFKHNKDHFKVEIKDDGIGFEQHASQQKEGLGLQNIINRAALIGGQGAINSSVNQGTSISILLPHV